MDSCGVAWSWRWTASDARRRGGRHRCAEGVWHRGAVDADGKTGDGAGLHVEIPQDFFKDHVRDSSGQAPTSAASPSAWCSLPRTDLGAAGALRVIVETEILRFGHTNLGWRQVPVDISVIGEKANATRPEIEQILIGRGNAQLDNREFEKQLYILRRRMEKAAIAENIGEFYVCSLSCRSIVYKGMFLAEHLSAFYPTCSTNASSRALRSSTSAIRPTPSRSGSSPSRSVCWRTTARSTRSWATSTG